MADTPDVRPVGDLPDEIGKTAARELDDGAVHRRVRAVLLYLSETSG